MKNRTQKNILWFEKVSNKDARLVEAASIDKP